MLELNSGRGTTGVTEVAVVEMIATGKVRVIRTTQTAGEVVKCDIFKARNPNWRLTSVFQNDVRDNFAFNAEDFDVLEFSVFMDDAESAQKQELEYIKKYRLLKSLYPNRRQ